MMRAESAFSCATLPGLRERGVAQVVVEVEAVVVDPDRVALDGDVLELLAVARDLGQGRSGGLADRVDVDAALGPAQGARLEDQGRGDVHVGVRLLEEQEGVVEGRESVVRVARHRDSSGRGSEERAGRTPRLAGGSSIPGRDSRLNGRRAARRRAGRTDAPRHAVPSHERRPAPHRHPRRGPHRAHGAGAAGARGRRRGGPRGGGAAIPRARGPSPAATACPACTRTTSALPRRPRARRGVQPAPNSLHCAWTDARPRGRQARALREAPRVERRRGRAHGARRRPGPGRVLLEAFHWRYHPLAARMLEVIASGELGAVRHVEARFCVPLLLPGDIRYRLDLAGGATMDTGCYAIHVVRTLAGAEPEVVSAEARLASPASTAGWPPSCAFPTAAAGAWSAPSPRRSSSRRARAWWASPASCASSTRSRPSSGTASA